MAAREEILEKLSEQEYVSQNALVEYVSVGKGRVTQILSEMEDPPYDEEKDEQPEPLIKKEKEGRRNRLTLTEAGKDEYISQLKEDLTENTPSGSGVNYGPSRSELDFHDIVVEAEIDNKEELHRKYGDKFGDMWAKSWLEHQQKDYNENVEGQEYIVHLNGFETWFTNEKVFIRIGKIREDQERVKRLFRKLMTKARTAIEWLECNTPCEFSSKYGEPVFRVQKDHLAMCHDVFAEMVVEHPETDLRNFRVYDEDDNLRMWIDNSEGERHLEFGSPSDWSVDDLHFVRDEVYRRMVQNKDSWRGLMDLIEDMDDPSSIPEELDSVKSVLGQNSVLFNQLLKFLVADRAGGMAQGDCSCCCSHNGCEERQTPSSKKQFRGLNYEQRGKVSASERKYSVSPERDRRLQVLQERLDERLGSSREESETSESSEWEDLLEADA